MLIGIEKDGLHCRFHDIKNNLNTYKASFITNDQLTFQLKNNCNWLLYHFTNYLIKLIRSHRVIR